MRANWHLADLVPDDPDPLDIRTVGTPIDLTGGIATLQAELRAALRIENRKFKEGVHCELKLTEDWPNAWSCRTCPHRTENPEDPMAGICASSMRQMDILDQIELLRQESPEGALAALADAHGPWAAWEAEDLVEAHGEWAMADAVGV